MIYLRPYSQTQANLYNSYCYMPLDPNNQQKELVGCLIVTRHVESVANQKDVIAGSNLDTPVSAKGIEQGIKLQGIVKDYLKRNALFISNIYTSFMTRAYYTAQQMANAAYLCNNKPPIYQEHALDEINWGILGGLTIEQAKNLYGKERLERLKHEISPNTPHPQNGENLYEVYQRAFALFVSRVLHIANFVQYDLNGNLPTVVMAVHSNIIKSLLYGMIRNNVVTNMTDIKAENMGRYLAKNATPLVFRVYRMPNGGLTLEATRKTIIDIEEGSAADSWHKNSY